MTLIVADASVVVKWLVPQQEAEPDIEQAFRLLAEVRSGRARLYQPAHWLAEAAAVVARLSPATARQKVSLLHAMGCRIVDDQAVYKTAVDLATDLNHHLFDTLYHAVALHVAEANLVTADERYFRKAYAYGRILRLADFDTPGY
ncbi:MAG: type II toxin-antitoxin system VapC family toxin [Gemmatimonadetes bacterium]|nr:type II toxin-antitoxin system VapC family toxin [Gemmatimonadota bacterium]